MDEEFEQTLQQLADTMQVIKGSIDRVARSLDEQHLATEEQRDRHTALLIVNVALMGELVDRGGIDPQTLIPRIAKAQTLFRNDVNAAEVALHITTILSALPKARRHSAASARERLARFFSWRR